MLTSVRSRDLLHAMQADRLVDSSSDPHISFGPDTWLAIKRFAPSHDIESPAFESVLAKGSPKGDSAEPEPERLYGPTSKSDSPTRPKSKAGSTTLRPLLPASRLLGTHLKVDDSRSIAWYAPLSVFGKRAGYFIDAAGFDQKVRELQSTAFEKVDETDSAPLAASLVSEILLDQLKTHHIIETTVIAAQFFQPFPKYLEYVNPMHADTHQESELAKAVAGAKLESSASWRSCRNLVIGAKLKEALVAQGLILDWPPRYRKQMMWELLSRIVDRNEFNGDAATTLKFVLSTGPLHSELVASSSWVSPLK